MQLERFVKTKNPSDLEKAGIIKAFEFTYETFWKTFGKIGEFYGKKSSTPREAFVTAYGMDLIKNENVWLSMLEDRNNTVHTYDEKIADEIYLKIKNKYTAEFKESFKFIIKKLGS